jgi:hypothetical protein
VKCLAEYHLKESCHLEGNILHDENTSNEYEFSDEAAIVLSLIVDSWRTPQGVVDLLKEEFVIDNEAELLKEIEKFFESLVNEGLVEKR